MRRKNISEQTININDNDQIITNKNYNDDRTMAFKINRQPHRADNIGWLVGSVFLFIFLVMSLGRLTIVGQLLDDTLFNFLFGWMKYLVYLILFGVNLAILIGLKFQFKKRFILMIITTWISIVWIMSASYLLVISPVMWSEDLFQTTISNYLVNWQQHSIFGEVFQTATAMKFAFWDYVPAFVNLGQAGGILGAVFAGSFGYASLPFSLILAVFVFFINSMWVLTGNPIYLFLPKAKRKGKRLRLLSLKANNNPYLISNKNTKEQQWPDRDVTEDIKLLHENNIEEQKEKEALWEEITLMNEAQNFDPSRPIFPRREKTFEFKHYNDDLGRSFYPDETKMDVHKVKHQTPQEFLAEQKAEFENLDPDEVRKKFAKEFSDIRPYGNIDDVEIIEEPSLVEKFAPFKEASLDDTDFLNDLEEETNLSDQFVEETNTNPSIEEALFDEDYVLPPLSLLDDFKQDQRFVDENKIYALEKKQAIDQAFNEFKVGAKVVDISYGPSVIKFQVLPEPGTKVNSISALENDLKLALASQNIRIEAPIPGKNLVGIEIENKHRLIVGLKELMSEITAKKFKSKLVFALGKDGENKPIFEDLAKMPHMLVAGSTGSGKSVMINTLIISLLMQTKPNEVKFLLIDPKKVELGIYSSLPHMLMPVISDMKQANQALKVVISEMERRYELFAKHNAKNLESYNNKDDVSQPLPYYVIIIDELADLMMTSNKREVEDSIMRITQMARAAGIHLIVATQRPSVDVVTGIIKANIPTRLAFSVASVIDSRTILDSSGAEKLTGRGDLLYSGPTTSDLLRAQGAYLSDEEIERVIDFITNQARENYAQSFITQLNKVPENNTMSGEDDDLYQRIKEFVIQNDKASISLIQRKFFLGYNKAANYIDQLEQDGIIGPANGAKAREVLTNK